MSNATMLLCCAVHITASLPVFVNQRLVGVVSADIDINKAMKRAAQLDGDEYSYYFLIAMNGDTYYHPMLSDPSDPDEPPVVVSIGILEKEALAAGVLASMMRYLLLCIPRIVCPTYARMCKHNSINSMNPLLQT